MRQRLLVLGGVLGARWWGFVADQSHLVLLPAAAVSVFVALVLWL
jgi:hypothetical protein